MKRTPLKDRTDISEILRGSTSERQQEDKAERQEDVKELKQQDSIPVNQHSVRRTKVTFYLEQQDIAALERERFKRRTEKGLRRGEGDLSALVREAIRKTFGTGD
jgi:hypothetical protein